MKCETNSTNGRNQEKKYFFSLIKMAFIAERIVRFALTNSNKMAWFGGKVEICLFIIFKFLRKKEEN